MMPALLSCVGTSPKFNHCNIVILPTSIASNSPT
uniref:Uncharacterized protein n=1 Tax=Rhizophora mucronata TaxID=61149 RepID=A0A2P2NES2_RHIMU